MIYFQCCQTRDHPILKIIFATLIDFIEMGVNLTEPVTLKQNKISIKKILILFYAVRLGIEPRFSVPETDVLPLDDLTITKTLYVQVSTCCYAT